MNRRVLHFFGIFMVFIGGCQCIPLIFALAFGEYREAGAFLMSIAICLVPGIAVRTCFRTSVSDENLGLRDSYCIVAVSWILASIFGALPFILSGVTDDYFLAFFETASGFSTTGATIFPQVEALPHCILIWRALTQWLGGMGMIVLFFALLPKFGIKASRISNAETPGPIQRKLTSHYANTAQYFYYAYILLTLILAVLLKIGGMSFFDAIAHALTTLATGGFSTHTGGLSYFDSSYIYCVIGIFAFLAGTNFVLFFDLLAGKFKSIIKDEEFRLYLLIIISSTLLISSYLKATGAIDSFFKSLSSALFVTLNTLSTLGFEVGNFKMPPFCLFILIFLMMIGGCSSSTSGGIKVSRLLMLFKAVKKEIRQRIYGTVADNTKYNNKKMDKNNVDYILSFTILFAAVVGIATIIISAFGGGDVLNNLLSVLSCIGNQGPSFDNFGLTCNYFTDSRICIITYTFVMIAGRLEIATFLVLFSSHFWNPNKA